MKLKKLASITCILVVYIGISAQDVIVKHKTDYDLHAIHFGFSLGVHYMDFNFKRDLVGGELPGGGNIVADLNTLTPGFNVNIVSDFRMGEYFSFRLTPGIILGQRDVNFIRYGSDSLRTSMSFDSHYIDFPLTFKYKAKRINNYRPFLIAGGAIRWDLASQKESADKLLLKPLGFYYEFGFGVDYFLYYVKVSTELKLSLGINNILNPSLTKTNPEYVKSLSSITSKIIILSFYFE
jgi:hypothetical protein